MPTGALQADEYHIRSRSLVQKVYCSGNVRDPDDMHIAEQKNSNPNRSNPVAAPLKPCHVLQDREDLLIK